MTGKVLEAQLVAFYCQLDYAIEEVVLTDDISVYSFAILKNQQIELDKILTSCSKQWAENKKMSRKDRKKC